MNNGQRNTDGDVLELVYLKWAQEFEAYRKLEQKYKDAEGHFSEEKID